MNNSTYKGQPNASNCSQVDTLIPSTHELVNCTQYTTSTVDCTIVPTVDTTLLQSCPVWVSLFGVTTFLSLILSIALIACSVVRGKKKNVYAFKHGTPPPGKPRGMDGKKTDWFTVTEATDAVIYDHIGEEMDIHLQISNSALVPSVMLNSPVEVRERTPLHHQSHAPTQYVTTDCAPSYYEVPVSCRQNGDIQKI